MSEKTFVEIEYNVRSRITGTVSRRFAKVPSLYDYQEKMLTFDDFPRLEDLQRTETFTTYTGYEETLTTKVKATDTYFFTDINGKEIEVFYQFYGGRYRSLKSTVSSGGGFIDQSKGFGFTSTWNGNSDGLSDDDYYKSFYLKYGGEIINKRFNCIPPIASISCNGVKNYELIENPFSDDMFIRLSLVAFGETVIPVYVCKSISVTQDENYLTVPETEKIAIYPIYSLYTVYNVALDDGTLLFQLNSRPVTEEEDLPESGDDSDIGGGGGLMDDSSDTIDFPELPIMNIADSGFITMYEMSQSDLRKFAIYLWSTNFFDNIIKLWQNPMELIINLHYFPIASENIDGVEKEMKIGNLSNTGVNAKKVSQQYYVVDCGTLSLNEYWGGFLDYNPYTQISLFLPFIGNVQLDIDDVMNNLIHVRYVLDMLSGSCVCHVKITSDSGLNSVLYSFSGNVNCTIPINSADYQQTYSALLRTGGSIVGGAVMGGGVGALAMGAQSALGNIGSKPTINKSSQMGSTSGLMGILTPFVEITRPIQHRPKNYNKYDGLTTYVTYTLNTLSGFTKCVNVNLQGLSCTDNEKEQIKQLLESGVYI